ncbi:bifunctional folylpolyglutamate synthase/dihydrofolate synthase [Candidatus Woesearchaeota archaeon B3_Woes]|nr:MAG: bifunctional folylpolyglutamate synthase/dihydrofolate synthase [Candidatus Woesearchaeota archaeon B3_Woes]
MNYEKSLKYLFNRKFFGMKLGLKNIRDLMDHLGNPQNDFKSIHVAGTNGKGSVCSFLSSILEKEGYKVGVYTSPHLVSFRERIKINGKKIERKEISSLLSKIKPFVKDHTFFEVVTALAFLYFKKKKVDIVLVEVGLGGRLDATNVITPEVSVITNIGLEHTEHLGDTLEKIAFEKSGIVKQNIPLVTLSDCKGLNVLKKTCKLEKCKLHLVKPKKLKISLKGNFQHQNASLALGVVDVLREKGYKISNKSVVDGLMNAKWPGRFEFVNGNILFDCAHNPCGAKTLAREIKKLNYKNIYFIVGIMKDKDIKGICKNLEPIAKEIIITKPHVTRAADPGEIADFIGKEVDIIDDIRDALEYAKIKASKEDLIVLTGSIFTVGEAFSFIRPDPFNSKVNKRSINNSK